MSKLDSIHANHAELPLDNADLSGQLQLQLLYPGQRTRVYRVQLPGRAGSVIAKEPRGADAAKRLQHERGMLERVAGVAGVPQLASTQQLSDMIAVDDVHGVTLASTLQSGRPPLPTLLQIAEQLTQTIAAVHRAGVVHNDINPTNVLLAGQKRRVLLIDFDLATTAAEGRPGFIHQNEIAGALPYLAPERTGRTGRPVDQRADLYALGATLYELFTGRPPFEGDDPLQLIRDHLARLPIAPAELDPSVPPALSEIVLRLLEKEPDRRYQSADGLAHDLARVRAAEARGEADRFPLGERDFPLRLAAPSRLIGRDAEIRALTVAFEAVRAGLRCGVLIAGAPGVGKSALIDELRPLATAHGGWLIAGKFDQYRREGASATNQAFRALGRLLLAEPEERLALERARILGALGSNVGVLTGLLPEFAILLGTQPPVVSGDPVEAEARLRQTSLSLLRTVASPERPIVMVLDDLQWAGAVAIRLIEDLLLDPELCNVLLVGAYRDAEVDATHPLSAMLPRWDRLGAAPQMLRLSNLPAPELGTLLEQMLRLRRSEGEKLASAIGARTGGNPYDTVELVNALRRDGALVPSHDSWSWDDAVIRRFVGQSEVLELLAARIARLPQAAQSLLETLACLGGDVRLSLLEAASGLSPAALEEQLTPALEDGLLVMKPGGDAAVGFPHDRVQQAAYGALPAARGRSLHLTIARRLAEVPAFAAEAAAQYLSATETLSEPGERRRVAELFREAADQAALASDQSSAERFSAAALALLSPLANAADKPLRLALESRRHMALYALGQLEQADQVYASIESHSREPLDMIDAASTQIASLTNRGRPHEAVTLGLGLVRRLGLPTPEGELGPQLAGWVDQMQSWVAAQAGLDESQRPALRDPVVNAAAQLLNRLLVPTYFCDQLVMTWVVAESQRLWSEYGPAERMIGPLAQVGLALMALREDYRTAYAATRHALDAGEARGFVPGVSQARFLLAFGGTPWFEPLEHSLQHALRAREGLLHAGELQSACYCYHASIPVLLDCAASLDACADEVAAGLALATRTGNDHSGMTLLAYRQLLRALRGATDAPGSFADGSFDPAAYLSALGGNGMARADFHIHRALAAALFGDAQTLIAHAALAMPLLSYVVGGYATALAQLLQALALAERARAASDQSARASLLAELDACRAWLALRAGDAPGNFLHLLHLVDAERAWAADDFRAASQAFDAALRDVATRPRPWHRGLIAERAAHFQLAHGLSHSAHALLAQARDVYRDWGASAKVDQLERAYVLRDAAGPHPEELPRGSSIVSSDTIDMLAILRASQTLSSETDLGRLQARVGELLGALTGATSVRVALWRDEPRGWYLSGAGDETTAALSVEDARARSLLPLSAFRYAERTREPLLVEDALHDDRFARDPYLQGLTRCSLLIVPILSKGVAHAVVLLENRLSRGAFSADRLSTVMLIAGQLAISLENALLYRELEQRVAQRTSELRETQADLVSTARRAGMAEIATNVLHNVGNVLNSVNVSAGLLRDKLQGSRVGGLGKAVQLINEHQHELGNFLSQDERGKRLPPYLTKLYEALAAEQRGMIDELEQLTKSIDHIKDIVATQQSYAGSSGVVENARIADLLEDALRINAGALVRHKVTVVREIAAVPETPLDRHRVLQILVNLISNAKDAMDAVPGRPHQITLRVDPPADRVLRVHVIDNGEGISPENLVRIFRHGFTTRKQGHGFGLHSCVLAAKAMGGTLTAHSDGPGLGATFTLALPIRTTDGTAPKAAEREPQGER